jgi:hypothetical protein
MLFHSIAPASVCSEVSIPFQIRVKRFHGTAISVFLKNLVGGLRIPFRDQPLRERDLHMGIQCALGVKIKYGRLHADSSLQPPLEAAVAEIVDEVRQIALAAQRVPIDRGAIVG